MAKTRAVKSTNGHNIYGLEIGRCFLTTRVAWFCYTFPTTAVGKTADCFYYSIQYIVSLSEREGILWLSDSRGLDAMVQ